MTVDGRDTRNGAGLRILFVLPSLRTGGAERALSTLLGRMDPVRHDLHLAVADGRDPAFPVPPGVVFHDLGARRVIGAALPLIRLARFTRPHIVFSALMHLNVMILALRRFFPPGTRFAAWEGSIPSRNVNNEPHPAMMSFLCRRLYPRADRVICQSRAMREDLCGRFGMPEGKTSVIFNPVDFEALDNQACGQSPYEGAGPGPHVLALGRLDPVKRFPDLIRAASRWRTRHPGLTLWFVGDGAERGALEELAASLLPAGAVRFIGAQKNVGPWLAGAGLFVLCSAHEGLPNALLEAIALGCPVLVREHPGGSREILEAAGLLDRMTPGLELFDGVFDRPPAKARHMLESAFGAGAVASLYERLFLELAGR